MHLAGEGAGKTKVTGDVEAAMNAGTAEVAVNQQRALVLLGVGDGEIESSRGLAFSGCGGRDEERTDLAFEIG